MFGLVPFKNHNDEMNSLLDVFNEPFFKDFPIATAGKFKVDVKDKGKDYELTAELPGLKKDEISLDYTNGYLTISAERNAEQNDEKANYIRRERHFGSMSRSFYIDDIDETKISAEFKDGILKVDLPKSETTVQPVKKILIK